MPLVLSCAAAADRGPWVLLIGFLYYAFPAAGRFRPAWRAPLPASAVRRAIGGFQPVALLLALVPGTPPGPGTAAVLTALALLLFSFGRDVVVLERMRRTVPLGAGLAR